MNYSFLYNDVEYNVVTNYDYNMVIFINNKPYLYCSNDPFAIVKKDDGFYEGFLNDCFRSTSGSTTIYSNTQAFKVNGSEDGYHIGTIPRSLEQFAFADHDILDSKSGDIIVRKYGSEVEEGGENENTESTEKDTEEDTENTEGGNNESDLPTSSELGVFHNNVVSTLNHIDTSISIIMVVLILFFCNWLLRSWRTWTSKIGKK